MAIALLAATHPWGHSATARAQAPSIAAAQLEELTPGRVQKPSGELTRRLERLAWMIDQRSWDEVCDLADELLAAGGDGWVEIDDHRYVGLREAVNRRLAELPPEGLAAYRGRIDALAADWLARGVAERDAALLQRVVDQAFVSAAGDDALWALGDMALERGDYQAARGAWQRIRAETGTDGALVYPDSPLALADVRARLALVSIREGDFDRADCEIAEIAAEHRDAAGRLGGREVNYSQRLAELLDQARQGSDEDEAPSTIAFERAWSAPLEPLSRAPGAVAVPDLVSPTWIYPAVANGLVLFGDATGIRARSLTTGENAAPGGRPLFASSKSMRPATPSVVAVDRRRVFAGLASAPDARRRSPPRGTSQLVGLDLARDGAVLWQKTPESADVSFSGTPVVEGAHVTIGQCAAAQGTRASIVCYDLWAPAPLWQRSLGSANGMFAPGMTAPVGVELAADAGVVYVNSNLGMVAAFRAEDGEPLWLRTYDRRAVSDGSTAYQRLWDPRFNPCVIMGSTVIAAPRDADQLFALDAATGSLLWSQPLPAPDAYVLAVDNQRVLLGGRRLWAVDLATGRVDPQWGAELDGGAGQGAVAGGLLFWPTDTEIHVLDRRTAEPAGESLPLPSAGGASLRIAETADGKGEYLIAAGPTHITAYRRHAAPPADAGIESNSE